MASRAGAGRALRPCRAGRSGRRRFYEEPVAAAELLPPAEIVASLRELGLAPTMQPIRRGAYYVLHAISADGIELRVVADAQLGDILSIEVARPLVAYTPYYVRAPHIIHVNEDGTEEIDSRTGDDRPKAASRTCSRRS